MTSTWLRVFVLIAGFSSRPASALACWDPPPPAALEQLAHRVDETAARSERTPPHRLDYPFRLGRIYITDPDNKRDRCPLFAWYWFAKRLARELGSSGVVVLGEIHDNPLHHEFRGAMVQALEQLRQARQWHPRPAEVKPPRPSPIIFEQLVSDRQETVDAAPRETAAFLKAIDWGSTGWSQYDYRPLFDAALTAKMPIYAGDVPKPVIRLAAKQGEAAIAPEERARLKLDVALPANQQDAILTELEASHCGMMPKTAFGGMAFAQRLRDATLADVALKAHATHGSAIVMAGNGHVRSDRGIAWYIRQRAPRIKVVTVALVEVEDGKTDPAAYVPLDPDGKPAVDYVVFTPQHVRPDPCDAFKKKP
jgi:uncharacterized iron-regulated protein